MASCAKSVVVDGNQFLALDPSQTNLATCSFVVQSGPEASLLTLSAEDGAIFSGGLISCWLAAWGIRQIISILRGSEHE